MKKISSIASVHCWVKGCKEVVTDIIEFDDESFIHSCNKHASEYLIKYNENKGEK